MVETSTSVYQHRVFANTSVPVNVTFNSLSSQLYTDGTCSTFPNGLSDSSVTILSGNAAAFGSNSASGFTLGSYSLGSLGSTVSINTNDGSGASSRSDGESWTDSNGYQWTLNVNFGCQSV